jgi:hypothetical protein
VEGILHEKAWFSINHSILYGWDRHALSATQMEERVRESKGAVRIRRQKKTVALFIYCIGVIYKLVNDDQMSWSRHLSSSMRKGIPFQPLQTPSPPPHLEYERICQLSIANCPSYISQSIPPSPPFLLLSLSRICSFSSCFLVLLRELKTATNLGKVKSGTGLPNAHGPCLCSIRYLF